MPCWCCKRNKSTRPPPGCCGAQTHCAPAPFLCCVLPVPPAVPAELPLRGGAAPPPTGPGLSGGAGGPTFPCPRLPLIPAPETICQTRPRSCPRSLARERLPKGETGLWSPPRPQRCPPPGGGAMTQRRGWRCRPPRRGQTPGWPRAGAGMSGRPPAPGRLSFGSSRCCRARSGAAASRP